MGEMDSKMKHNIPTEPGFELPEGYFDSFDEQLEEKLFFEKLPKSTGFETPSDYLSNFEVQVPKEPKQSKVISLVMPILKYGVAASLVIALVSTAFLMEWNNSSYENMYDNLSSQEVNTWLESYDGEIKSSDFIAVYEDEIIESENLPSTSLNISSIENYLNESSETELVIDEFY